MKNALSLLGAGVVVVAALSAAVARRAEESPVSQPAGSSEASSPHRPPAPSARPRPGRGDFVGSSACAACHRAQSQAYLESHHAKALVSPTPEMAKARFDGGHFTSWLGGTTKFALRDGAPVVSSPGPGGRTQVLPVAYVSGVWPLEQYVVATERGKLQSLGVVWDSRAKDEGGSRWLHVYGPTGIAPRDPLFFTSAAQNWNHTCADCHSTRVERRYDVATDSFDTRWAELSVGCEACHGPGAEHARSAKAGGPVVAFAAQLKKAEPWRPSPTDSPTPRSQDGVEVEACAPCHSRRQPLMEDFLAGDPFLDSFAPELLRAGSYHADGQVEGEVYEWGSFLQSRMYQAGVRCSDCHEPHSGKLLASGNALCGRCHEPARFDVAAHSHHAGPSAPRCIDCHMPPATFMQIDERRDHSIRIPRPDHSERFGTPNACTLCHSKESASWATQHTTKWFPASHHHPHFVDALGSDRQGSLEAPGALRKLAADAAAPAIARATALERLGTYAGEQTLRTLRSALGSPDSLVVYGAALGAAALPPQQRAVLLVPTLSHDARAVRIAAAKALAGIAVTDLAPTTRAALDRAFLEVEQSFDVSASRAETHVERSAFELARGNLSKAETSLQIALRFEPCLTEAHLNLADLWRERRSEPEAERAIRAALACSPQSAAAHHALGLWLVRARQWNAAIASLKKAVAIAPADPRFSYVLAAAMAQKGDRREAIRVLEKSLVHHPNDATSLQALGTYLHEDGQLSRAAETRHKLDMVVRE